MHVRVAYWSFNLLGWALSTFGESCVRMPWTRCWLFVCVNHYIPYRTFQVFSLNSHVCVRAACLSLLTLFLVFLVPQNCFQFLWPWPRPACLDEDNEFECVECVCLCSDPPPPSRYRLRLSLSGKAWDKGTRVNTRPPLTRLWSAVWPGDWDRVQFHTRICLFAQINTGSAWLLNNGVWNNRDQPRGNVMDVRKRDVWWM